jgi:hypothetical protein
MNTSATQDRYIRILHLRNRPWQQEKQHQMSQVSDEYRHRQSETVSVKTAYAPDVLNLAQYWDVGIDCKGQQSKGLGPARCNRVRGWDLQNWRRVWLIQRWIKIHAAEKRWPYTCLQTPEWEVRKELRPWGRQFRRRTCDDVGCHILLNWCTSSAILAPLDTDMRFWHHTCCPQWTSVGKFFSTTTLGRTQLWLLLTF